MKKILFFILLSMSVTCFGQGSQNIDSIQTTEVDSIHAGSHAFPDTKLEDATKAEGDSAYIKDDYTMIDVGTGAGFPGLPIAISSKAEVTLLDSLNKRVNFLNSISTELGLNNVNTIHGRAEEMGANQKYREKYDVAVSRAVAPMNVLVEYLLPFVKIGGICICMKGPKADEELKEAKRAIKLLGGEIIKQEKLKLDNEKMERNLIIIKKVSTTAKKYPRKPGMPAKQPL